MSERAVVLMSVKSPHVERLLDGSKTVELRRRPVRLSPGSVVLLYAAGTRRELVGSFEIGGVDRGSPASLWRRHRHAAGITKREFDRYFDEAEVAYAVVAVAPRVLKQPIPLAELRRRWPGFSTPQTHRRVAQPELKQLLNGERSVLLVRSGFRTT